MRAQKVGATGADTMLHVLVPKARRMKPASPMLRLQVDDIRIVRI